MAMNFLSPGVNYEEIDNSQTTASVGMWAGACVIQSGWGPVEYPTFVDSQSTLIEQFGKPNNDNFKSWFSASNYLDYTASMYVVRSSAANLTNACEDPSAGAPLIKNESDYALNWFDGQGNCGQFAAKYAGALGNSLLVTYADAKTFQDWVIPETDSNGDKILGTKITSVTIENAGLHYKNTDTVEVLSDSGYGAKLTLTVNEDGSIASVTIVDGGSGYNPDVDTIEIEGDRTEEEEEGTGAVLKFNTQVMFDCRDLFAYAPSTSAYAQERGGSNDEIHLLVIDAGGEFTGSRYTVLEKYENLSKSPECKSLDGTANSYRRVLLDQSQYVYWMDYPSGKNWEHSVSNHTFDLMDETYAKRLSGGADDYEVEDSDIMLAFDEFKNKEAYDITNVICGAYSKTVAKYVVENICEDRLDCVAFISPNEDGEPIKGTQTQITTKTIAWREDSAFNVNSSYAVMDSGWKYQYDKFNDEYRWIPLCADVAGLRARTSENQYPWFSEAGYNRGQIKNVVKLSFNPSKSYRDLLYPKGINPVVTFAGEGTILYGDKTLLTKPSAFQHTNVRFLFIYLEKTLVDAAKYLLFEINDEITRAYAKNLCEPFLDEVMGSRGIYAYKVVCDTTNNTDLVIDNNKFALDIYVQPARSINFISMKFVAEKTGSSFTEAG